jgi:hypothetical protein
MVNPITEKNVMGDIVLYEHPSHYSRDTAVIVSGAGVLKPGSVLGKRTKTAADATADGGNTGDGTISAVTLGALAETGTYKIICIGAATDGGTFAVYTPAGFRLADALVGTAYAGGHLNFTISDGAADFVVGDTFTVDVTGDGKYDFAKAGDVTGLADAAVVLLEEVDATAADVADALVLARDAIVSEQGLVFHSSVDDATKRAAMKAGLKGAGILSTQGV